MVVWSQCERLITVQFMSENVLVVDDKALEERSDRAQGNIKKKQIMIGFIRLICIY